MSNAIDKTNILNYLKEHYKEFKNKYDIEQIGLFGSYARDEATEDSDIDIFVKMPGTLGNYIGIKEDREDAFKKEVDIIRMREQMNPYLQKRIIKDGIYAL